MTPFHWRVALIAILVVAGAIRAHYDRQQNPSTLRDSIGNVIAEAGRMAFYLTLLQLLGVELLPMQLNNVGDMTVRITGLLFVAVGSFVFVWARAVRSKTWGDVMQDPFSIRDHFLCTWGPYGYVRHPTYIGMLIIAMGVEMAVASWMIFVIFFPLAISVVAATHKEERDLHMNYGIEFDRYKRNTPWRLVPRII